MTAHKFKRGEYCWMNWGNGEKTPAEFIRYIYHTDLCFIGTDNIKKMLVNVSDLTMRFESVGQHDLDTN